MSPSHFPPELLDSLTQGDLSQPRSLLGFHELGDGTERRWVVRVWEPDAVEAEILWGQAKRGLTMQRLVPGAFEWSGKPRRSLTPYRVRLRYPDGAIHERYDGYYFPTRFSPLDQHLFGEGTHYRLHNRLGAHPLEQEGVSGTWFAVWAPNARRVSVVGDFNGWDGRRHLMHSVGSSGVWELFIPEVGVGTLYKFELKTQSGELLLKSDPFAFASELRPATASRVASTESFPWQDAEWMEARRQRDPLKQPISIYEVHLGSWRRIPEEQQRFLTYREAADQLIPYVQEMGYTHIELLPVSEFPFDGSWGYQVTGYFAPTSRHGTPEDFMHFVDRCHEAGLGVILDWVPGHFPKDAHGLARFDGTGLYEHEDTRQGEHREWGTLVFNYERNEVRNFLISSALHWFEQYHIDGIRVDAVASMLYLDYAREAGEWVPNEYGGRENLGAIRFLRQLHEVLFREFPGILSIAEESTAWPGVSRPTYVGGLGFNLKWNMGWMNDTLRYMAKDPVHRRYEHHWITFSLVYAFSENYVLAVSHDEVVHGKSSLLGKMPGDFWQQCANVRLYLSFMMCHPGKKLLFMGQEFGQGREWSEARSLDWHLLEIPEHRQLQECQRTLNHLYQQHPSLHRNDFHESGFRWIDLHDADQSVLSFLRFSDEAQPAPPLVCVFNFTPVPRDQYVVGLPQSGTYQKIFDSDEARFGGSGYNQQSEWNAEPEPWQGLPARAALDLPPLGCLILALRSE
jgi:1,4-alpha-glucan branching enzyme